MKKLITTCITLMITYIALSQTTIISGNVNGAAGKKIRIIMYADMISYLEQTVAETRINNNGDFKIQINNDTTVFTYLKIDFQQAEFYLEPDNEYDLIIDFDPHARIFSYTNPINLRVRINNAGKNSLNHKISEFNKIYSNFIYNNFYELYKKHNISLLDSLQLEVDKSFKSVNPLYFKNYIKYSNASVDLFAKFKTKQEIANDYLINQPVLYNNIKYMDFFNQFAEKYFTNNTNISQQEIISQIIDKKSNFNDLILLLQKDNILRKDHRILEMVLLKTLHDLYHNPNFNKAIIIEALEKAARQFKTEENKKISVNLIKKLTMLTKDTKVPDFQLPNATNDTFSLEDFRGKIIYLNFWNLVCRPCIEEMDTIKNIYKRYDNTIQFISISTDVDPEQSFKYAEEKDYNWLLLHFDNNFELLEKYDVRTYPKNLLIDKHGTIIKNPAVLPRESFRIILSKIANKNLN